MYRLNVKTLIAGLYLIGFSASVMAGEPTSFRVGKPADYFRSENSVTYLVPMLADPNSPYTGEAPAIDWTGESGAEAEPPPEHIRDNAFLVEEAFNQEAGEIQHIFNWIQVWDRTAAGRTRDFLQTYTMEIPLGSQSHQFSFTTQFVGGYERSNGQLPESQGGVGDTFLNYRYQLLSNDEFLWCAPRISLIVPTGDERFGLGSGQLGYQFNLPISKYGDKFDFHFNAGCTKIPNVKLQPSMIVPIPTHDLQGYNLGGSVFWKPRVDLNFFVEALALWNDEIQDNGTRQNIKQVFINPGVRKAVCQFEQVEWILGVSVPVGLTTDTPDIGVFAYMSVEHIFLKVDE